MIKEALKNFSDFPDKSRTWVYQADRDLSEDEIHFVEANLANFTTQWEAHGKQLHAKGEVILNRFLVIMIDENNAAATGCSIDKSVHFVEQLGKTLMIDWFNRLNIIYLDEHGVLSEFDFRKAEELMSENKLTPETMIFNNNVASKGDMIENWLVAIKDSWMARQLM